MKPFPKRIYHTPAEFLADFHYIFSRRKLVRRAMRQLISYPFRERLMMTVTAVNGCRYCRYYHIGESKKAGLTETEMRDLLAGQIPADAPAAELPALMYAQTWADANADPPAEAVQLLLDTYGAEMADAIHIVLRMIRVGNLLGNTTDYLLYRFSFGKFGGV